MPLKMRTGKASDIPQLYEFEKAYIIEYEPEAIEKWVLAKDNILSNLHKSIDRMVVLQRDSEIIAFGYWNILRKKPCVSSIYVVKEHRGRGYGEQILHRIETMVIEAGFRDITLETLEVNPAQYLFSKMFYKKMIIADGWIHYSKDLI